MKNYFVFSFYLLISVVCGFQGGRIRAGNGTVPFVPEPPPNGTPFTSDAGDFTMTWQVDTAAGTIHMQMSCPTKGWISVGWSTNPTMRQADYYTGSVDDATNQVTLLDTYSTADSQPAEDTDPTVGGKNDIIAITGFSQTNGVTTIAFKRKLDTGDTKGDFAIKNTKMWLQWAYADTDIRADGSYDIHTVWGVAQSNLIAGGASTSVWGPGSVFGLLVGCIAAAYTIVRVAKKIYKCMRKRGAKKEIKNVESAKDNDKSSSTNPKFYYKGSQKVTASPEAKFDQDGPEFEKPPGSSLKNQFWGVIQKRVNWLDTPMISVIIGVLWVIINIACLWTSDVSLFNKTFGDLASINAVILMLPATRNSALVWATGIPFDHAILYHRWLGYWTMLLTAVHMVYSFVIWFLGGADVAAQFSTKTNVLGLTSFFCGLVMTVSSLEFVRRKFFEVFYYSHFLFIPFFITGYFHNKKFLPYIAMAAILYVVDRFIRMIWGIIPSRTLEFKVKGVKDQIVQVRYQKNWLARKLGLYKPGQYMFLNFPKLSLLEWHPYSVSSGANETSGEIHIKGLGTYTNKLIELAKTNSSLWIRVDGPYGNLNMNWRRYPILILVQGGIGVTPGLGLIRTIFKTGELDPSTKVKSHCVERVFFIWTVQNKDQYSWFSAELGECYANSNKKESSTPKLDLMIYVTRDKTATQQEGFISGRPNIQETIVKIGNTYPDLSSSIFVCGPKTMVDNCWDAANALKKKGQRCHFHHETFEF